MEDEVEIEVEEVEDEVVLELEEDEEEAHPKSFSNLIGTLESSWPRFVRIYTFLGGFRMIGRQLIEDVTEYNREKNISLLPRTWFQEIQSTGRNVFQSSHLQQTPNCPPRRLSTESGIRSEVNWLPEF